MPIRQPWSGDRPASSACSSSGRPLFEASRPLAVKLTHALRCRRCRSAARSGVNVSTAGSGRPSSAQRARTASIRAGGPQTKVAASAWSEMTADRCSRAKRPASCDPRARVKPRATLERLMVAGELAQLGAIQARSRRARVVQEADLTVEALIAKRAQHRHHRGDSAAAADQQHTLGARVGQDELAPAPGSARRSCPAARGRADGARPCPPGGWRRSARAHRLEPARSLRASRAGSGGPRRPRRSRRRTARRESHASSRSGEA